MPKITAQSMNNLSYGWILDASEMFNLEINLIFPRFWNTKFKDSHDTPIYFTNEIFLKMCTNSVSCNLKGAIMQTNK